MLAREPSARDTGSSVVGIHNGACSLLRLPSTSGLPAIYGFRTWVDAGGLISYGPNLPDLFHRAATYVDISKHAGRVNDESILVDEIAA